MSPFSSTSKRSTTAATPSQGALSVAPPVIKSDSNHSLARFDDADSIRESHLDTELETSKYKDLAASPTDISAYQPVQESAPPSPTSATGEHYERSSGSGSSVMKAEQVGDRARDTNSSDGSYERYSRANAVSPVRSFIH